MRRKDHYTRTYRSEEALARHASRLRLLGGVDNDAYFDILKLFNNILLGKEIRGKGVLSRIYLPSDSKDGPAEVSYRPLVLRIDKEIEDLAGCGEPLSRHILAHEIGHILLHDHDSKAFSNDAAANISFAEDEYSTEWQANKFAEYLLLPDSIIEAFHVDVDVLATRCSVPKELARDRVTSFKKQYDKKRLYSGDACPECENFTVRHVGLDARCDTCGAKRSVFTNAKTTRLPQ